MAFGYSLAIVHNRVNQDHRVYDKLKDLLMAQRHDLDLKVQVHAELNHDSELANQVAEAQLDLKKEFLAFKVPPDIR